MSATAVRETKEETGLVVETGPVVSVTEQITDQVHDLFVVFRAHVISGEAAVSGVDDDVTETRWMTLEEAGTVMPWYRSGLAGLLDGPGAEYDTVQP
ncbi:NUDIX hydrolase [Planomonospora sp. ID67723]|uniref:NUDIX domain-containing protein n=1 Tax=Planomonospora sp. ID67723 TaxID=2738134 RepID=UPI0018C3984A|nr:NUDIX hydrolase [Planomonospora sp. ID67723]MBG0831562.1 NUDIX hydrolase [Planomonospora sp. ID67723]